MGTDIFGKLALEELGSGRGKLDHLHSALNFPERVGVNLAMLGDDHVRKLTCAILEDSQKPIEHTCTP